MRLHSYLPQMCKDLHWAGIPSRWLDVWLRFQPKNIDQSPNASILGRRLVWHSGSPELCSPKSVF